MITQLYEIQVRKLTVHLPVAHFGVLTVVDNPTSGKLFLESNLKTLLLHLSWDLNIPILRIDKVSVPQLPRDKADGHNNGEFRLP